MYCISVPTYFALMCIYVIYKCLSGGRICSRIWASQTKKQPSQAIAGKLLSVLSHMVSEKTQSALRKDRGWTHSLRCCQQQAIQVCIRHCV